MLRGAEQIAQTIKLLPPENVEVEKAVGRFVSRDVKLAPLFKQIILLYRRYRAANTERLTEKTIQIELADSLERDIKALDRMVAEEWFKDIATMRLPRLKDFMPVQYVEAAEINQIPFSPRLYDEKFHILQSPQLLLPDLAFFRAKREDREIPLAVAFLDIDDFKSLNTAHTEPKIDRHMLPRFMQAIEAHLFQHGYAYRQGGDEYLVIVPGLSRNFRLPSSMNYGANWPTCNTRTSKAARQYQSVYASSNRIARSRIGKYAISRARLKSLPRRMVAIASPRFRGHDSLSKICKSSGQGRIESRSSLPLQRLRCPVF